MDLTPLHLTTLGLVHTILSVVVVFAAVVALLRNGEISPQSGAGRFYIWTLVLTVVTGLPIFRHGGIGPPHIAGVVILVLVAIAAMASRTQIFGRLSAYVRTIAYTLTVFVLGVSTVTETLTRLPPDHPIVASPDAPIFPPIYLGWLVVVVIFIVFRIRKMRAKAPA